MELISRSVCDLNTNEGNLRCREPTVPLRPLPHESRGVAGGAAAPLLRFPCDPSLAIKNHSVYYNMPHTKIHIIETDKDTKIINYDVSSVVVKPTIAQQWAKIGGDLYQLTKSKKNKKIVPNNDNIQTGWWD
jgi:hypothetical protein